MPQIIRSIIYKKKALGMKIRGFMTRLYLKTLGGKCGTKLHIGSGVTFKHPPHKKIVFGNNITIGDNVIFDIEESAELIIGNNVKITGPCYIAASKKIQIGDSTLIAEYVSIRDSNHQSALDIDINQQALLSENVIIGRDVWIGRGCAIIKGSLIEAGSIIAANSVLNKPTSMNSVFGGSPAKFIKNRS